jgi:hypothetical protein
MKRLAERKKAARCGCGLLENVADLAVQRCRRTRRDPSSSIERRRKLAGRLVRFRIMGQGDTAERPALSSGSFGIASAVVTAFTGTTAG